MKATLIFTIVLFIQLDECVKVLANLQDEIRRKLHEGNSTSLSRTRRYLVFPEGSSFQVVFDLTYPAIAIQGNVFTFGHTAAMAWELPSEPIFLDKKKIGKGDEKEENMDTTTMKVMPEHLDYDEFDQVWQPPLAYSGSPEFPGWPYDRSHVTYHKNPFEIYQHQNVIQDSDYVEGSNFYNQNPSQFWSRTNFGRNLKHQTSTEKTPHNQSQTINRTVAHHIQRRSRRDLYTKVEKLLTALSKDGKSCVLKAICQVRKLPAKKGTMWEEIVKAIFSSKHDMYPDEDHYDEAANVTHDCDKIYPNCDGHVLSNLFDNRMRKI